jgi:hypothetical protein
MVAEDGRTKMLDAEIDDVESIPLVSKSQTIDS